MLRTHAVGAWLLLAPLAGCGEPDPELVVSEIRPVLLDTCRPGSPPRTLEIRALGDFPAAETDRLIEVWSAEDGRLAIDRFPLETRALAVSAVGLWEAGGLFAVPAGDSSAAVVLLPFDRSCAILDADVRAPDGSVVVALPDGGMFVAGGVDAGSRVVRVAPPGGPLAEVLDDPLFNGRAHATGTLAGAQVFIVGGASEPTFEVFDLGEGRLDREASGRMPGPARRNHGAIALDDARVLVVGGEDPSGEALQDAVVVSAGTASAVAGPLAIAHTEPSVLRLDDGRVFVAGGFIRSGAVAATVEHFDVDAESFETVVEPFDADASGVAVALPGSRIAWLAHGDGRIEIMSFAQRDALSPVVAEAALTEPLPTGFGASEVAVLADGDIVVSGGDVILRVDVGTGQARILDETSSARRLVSLADGSIAELSTESAWLRRLHLRTSFDNPPATLLPADTDWLAFDAASHWDRGTALEDAFVHLPTLRFRRVRITTLTSGPADLFIHDEGGETIRVVLDAEQTEVGLCELAHEAGAEVTVEVDDDAIVLRAADAEQRCQQTIAGSVALSWKLFAGSRLDAVRVERL